MNVGAAKGKILTNLIAKLRPQVMIELGGYVGDSAILFGDSVPRAGGERYYSLEMNPEFAAIVNTLIDLAGLRDFVRILVGRIADNVIYPGNPPYLEYVRSTVEQKCEITKSGPAHCYNTEGFAERTVQAYIGKDATPLFDIIGNPNLVYSSTLQ
ncbi:uncharacterized protein ATNIH1004_006364 [Aspergillus tanneri]|uniref:catechol O-methyltransferase n=1 Tax=Aspergillus tanneri TaxID=1220188 RepID=A0A5M9MQU3_9EURO|nr:uncharacterized protein ATNIH1004_006364 [Aspergillus tanneri]KAA8647670.1 hypothetical protein ATNIH1004_006364 [Aspergillus tanneri]